MTFKEQLIKKRACKDALEWVENRTMKEALEQCHRGDWLLWMVGKFELCDIRKLTLIKVECVDLVKGHLTDERSRNALVVARKFAKGKATKSELNSAYASAAAAYTNAAASSYAAAAYSVAGANDGGAVAVAVADTVSNGVAAIRKETLLKCANIVRKHIKIKTT